MEIRLGNGGQADDADPQFPELAQSRPIEPEQFNQARGLGSSC